jgi:hypothetical protein
MSALLELDGVAQDVTAHRTLVTLVQRVQKRVLDVLQVARNINLLDVYTYKSIFLLALGADSVCMYVCRYRIYVSSQTPPKLNQIQTPT